MSVPTPSFTFIQRIFIKRFNYLLKKSKVRDLLEPEEVCRGLSILFMYYEQKGEQDEFLKFLQAIQGLNKEDIIKIIKGEKISINGEEYDKDKLIAFSNKLHLARTVSGNYGFHQKSFKKLAGENWDNSIAFVTNLTNLKAFQKNLNLSVSHAGTYYFSFPKHAVSIIAHEDGTYTYFDPNRYNVQLNKKFTLKQLTKKLIKIGNSISKTLKLSNEELIVQVEDLNFKQGNERIAENSVQYVIKAFNNSEEVPNIFKQRILLVFRKVQNGNISSLLALKNIKMIILEMNGKGIKRYNFLQEEISKCVEIYTSSDKLIKIKSPDKNMFSDKEKQKYSLLLLTSVGMSDIDTVKYLLDKGVSTNVAADQNYTALHIAVDNNDYEMVKFLLSYPDIQINRKINGLTAFDRAIDKGHTSIAQLFLADKRFEKKVNIDLTESLKKYISHENTFMVDTLLKLGVLAASAEVHEKEWISPLLVALQGNNKSVVKALLGAGVNMAMENGRVKSLMAAFKLEEDYILRPKNWVSYLINYFLGIHAKLKRFIAEIRKDDSIDDMEKYQKQFEIFFQKIPKFLRKLTNLSCYRESLQHEIVFNKASEIIRELESKPLDKPASFKDLASLISSKLQEAGLKKKTEGK